jgi:hypothetical protein
MNILMVHGVNTNEDLDPYGPWQTAVVNGLRGAGYAGPINADPAANGLRYNDIFDAHSAKVIVYGVAAAELIGSAAWHTIVPSALAMAPQVQAAQPSDGFMSAIRWSAGMVAQWVVESGLRTDCRDRLDAAIQGIRPDVILAQSLGSLICYDLFKNDPRGSTIFSNGILVTFGSQIGNPFIMDRMWGGKVTGPSVKMWYNLYNPPDPVFVSSISCSAPNFHEFIVNPQFGGTLDLTAHDATTGSGHPGYLDNSTTIANLWPALAGGSMASLIARNIRIVKAIPPLAIRPASG